MRSTRGCRLHRHVLAGTPICYIRQTGTSAERGSWLVAVLLQGCPSALRQYLSTRITNRSTVASYCRVPLYPLSARAHARQEAFCPCQDKKCQCVLPRRVRDLCSGVSHWREGGVLVLACCVALRVLERLQSLDTFQASTLRLLEPLLRSSISTIWSLPPARLCSPAILSFSVASRHFYLQRVRRR